MYFLGRMGLLDSMMSSLVILLLSCSSIAYSETEVDLKPCDSDIYCHGELLHTVQMNHVYKDSKTFVDMPMRFTAEEIKSNFTNFMSAHKSNLTKEAVTEFVRANFYPDGEEFESWDPVDYKDQPAFLQKIHDPKLKTWAYTLHSYWKVLGRKIKVDVKIHPEKYSMMYVPNPVIVPGGRFKEFYYWDSYWIQLGLILSEMTTTVKGMLENFILMVDELGYIPNGGRVYFRRSQPPFLTPMVHNYVKATGDMEFLRSNLPKLEREFEFWVNKSNNRYVELVHGGQVYHVCIFNSMKAAPRPESYREDLELVEHEGTNEGRNELFYNMHAGAESGWDFSSRWFKVPHGEKGKLRHTKTREIVPVDLNSLMYLNAKLLAEYNEKFGTPEKVARYENFANSFRAALNDVMWDEDLGSWFDYDLKSGERRTEFYPSNIFPLWVGVQVQPSTIKKVLAYLRSSKVLVYPSGVPTSLEHTNEQWDFPNGWAPLQHLMVEALVNTGNDEAQEIAFEIAEKWLLGNYKAFYKSKPHAMFEKYDVSVDGIPGGGGEYDVVTGFGWSNGVILDFMARLTFLCRRIKVTWVGSLERVPDTWRSSFTTINEEIKDESPFLSPTNNVMLPQEIPNFLEMENDLKMSLDPTCVAQIIEYIR